MISILCDKCNHTMRLEEEKTLLDYSRKLGYKVLEGGEIDLSTIPNYAIYRCESCMNIKKYTLKELEFQIRRSIATEALNIRMISNKHIFKDIDTDSQMFYCGKCVGVFSESKDGYCLKSVSEKCRIYLGLYT